MTDSHSGRLLFARKRREKMSGHTQDSIWQTPDAAPAAARLALIVGWEDAVSRRAAFQTVGPCGPQAAFGVGSGFAGFCFGCAQRTARTFFCWMPIRCLTAAAVLTFCGSWSGRRRCSKQYCSRRRCALPGRAWPTDRDSRRHARAGRNRAAAERRRPDAVRAPDPQRGRLAESDPRRQAPAAAVLRTGARQTDRRGISRSVRRRAAELTALPRTGKEKSPGTRRFRGFCRFWKNAAPAQTGRRTALRPPAGCRRDRAGRKAAGCRLQRGGSFTSHGALFRKASAFFGRRVRCNFFSGRRGHPHDTYYNSRTCTMDFRPAAYLSSSRCSSK